MTDLLNLILISEAPAPVGEAAGGAAEGTGGLLGGGMEGILLIVAMIAIFYFMMIRPQQKQQKKLQQMRDALKAGDKVITAGGICGKIAEVKDDYVIVSVADGVKIRVLKTAVNAEEEKAEKK
ncbi:MAG: preprotein translocase subunit YajC [Muribaculaceae bacterium]|nr:preprotein translocase subunit YajC [Muribaculaceae bacterium]